MRKNILKPLFIILTAVILFNLNFGNILAATTPQDINQAANDLATGSPIKSPDDIFNILAKILRYVYTIFFITAVIFIIVAAFGFLTARDDPAKIKSARAQLYWAAVAIAIALISVGAAQIIRAFITPTTLT